MDTLVVTGTKTEVKQSNVTDRVDLYTREDIEKSAAVSTEEFLHQLPGITVSQHGSYQINIAGEDGRYTKVLIDGIPVTGDVVGAFPLQSIPLAMIERVEIVRGTASSLYGSDAMAGVINFITRKPKQPEPISGSLSYNYGSNIISSYWNNPGFRDTSITLVSNNGKPSRWAGEQYGDIAVNHSNRFFNIGASGGFSYNPGVVDSTEPKFNKIYPYYTMSEELRTNGRISLFTSPTDRQTISGSMGVVHSYLHTSPTLTQRYRIEDTRLSGDLTHQITLSDLVGIQWWATGQKHNHGTEMFSFESAKLIDSNTMDFSMAEAEIMTSISPQSHVISVGVNGKYETVEGDDIEGESKSGYEGALFIQDLWNIKEADRLLLTSGARFTLNSRYKGNVSPKLGVRFNATDWFYLRMSGGFGYKAPTFKNNYFVYLHDVSEKFLVIGNEDLLPETSVGSDITLGFTPISKLNIGLSGHYRQFRDMITYMKVSDSSGLHGGSEFDGIYEYVNLDNAVSTGGDVRISWIPNRWISLNASYQFIYKEEEEKSDSLEYLTQNPHEIRGDLGYSPHEIKATGTFTIVPLKEYATQITPTISWLSKKLVDQATGTTIPPYFMMNLTVKQPIRSWIHTTIALKNVTDNKSQEHGLGYGRVIAIGVHASFPTTRDNPAKRKLL